MKNRIIFKPLVVVFCALFVQITTTNVQAEIFKCSKTSGEVYYNDKPCPVGVDEKKIKAVKDIKNGYQPNSVKPQKKLQRKTAIYDPQQSTETTHKTKPIESDENSDTSDKSNTSSASSAGDGSSSSSNQMNSAAMNNSNSSGTSTNQSSPYSSLNNESGTTQNIIPEEVFIDIMAGSNLPTEEEMKEAR